jgi:hypothetical protein
MRPAVCGSFRTGAGAGFLGGPELSGAAFFISQVRLNHLGNPVKSFSSLQ